eukprot:g2168.t1
MEEKARGESRRSRRRKLKTTNGAEKKDADRSSSLIFSSAKGSNGVTILRRGSKRRMGDKYCVTEGDYAKRKRYACDAPVPEIVNADGDEPVGGGSRYLQLDRPKDAQRAKRIKSTPCWVRVFQQSYNLYESSAYASVRTINRKMFESVRRHIGDSAARLKMVDPISTAIVVAADADEDVHFQQLKAYLEAGTDCIETDREKDWVVVRLRHIDPDESRSPAVIWHRVLVSLCKRVLCDGLRESGDRIVGSKKKNEEEGGKDAAKEKKKRETDDEEETFLFTQPANLEDTPASSSSTSSSPDRNSTPKDGGEVLATSTSTVRTLRTSTSLQKIIMQYDAEALAAMRQDQNEWRWLRGVAGGYGGMPHELLLKWLSRHRGTLNGMGSKTMTVVVLQLEGVEHFAPETLEELVRTCTLVKMHLRKIGIEDAIQFSLLFGAATEAGVNFVVRPWRSALVVSTFWKASPVDLIACVERPLIMDRILPLMLCSESAEKLRDMYFADSYSMKSYLAGLRLCLLTYLTSSTFAAADKSLRVALEAKLFLLRGLDDDGDDDGEFLANVLTQCRSLPSVHRAMDRERARKLAEEKRRTEEYADSEDTKTASSASSTNHVAPPSLTQLKMWRDDLLCKIGVRGFALRCLHEIMRLTNTVGKHTSCSLFAIDVTRMQESQKRKRRQDIDDDGVVEWRSC